MSKTQTCFCGKGSYTHGSALYDFYSCGHAFEKPLCEKEGNGRFIYYKSPYEPYKSQYKECKKSEGAE